MDLILNNQAITEANINELVRQYSLQLNGKAEGTKQVYIKRVQDFINYFKDKGINYINENDLNEYKATLEHQALKGDSNKTLSPNYINISISAIKDFYNFLERNGLKNEAKNLKKEKIDREFYKEPLTLEQVKQVLQSIDTSNEIGARNYAILKLLFSTALRICEVVRANNNDLETLGDKHILRIKGKGRTSKNSYVVIEPSVMRAIQNYKAFTKDLNEEAPLFTSTANRNKGQRLTTRTLQRFIKDVFYKNGIISKRITAHSTRHTAITLSILNGAKIEEAQAMARHKNINMTMRYFHYLNRLEGQAESKLEELFSNI